jgi:integrase/recombinase XerD
MSEKSVTLSQAIEGYTIHAYARRLSVNTVVSYEWAFRRLESVVGRDKALASITTKEIRSFLASMSDLSNKSVLNAHVALSALWTWGVGERIVPANIIREVRPPKAEIRDVIPFDKKDVQAMLTACDRSKPYVRPGKRSCDNKRPTALRDRAIVMLLLDTGIRAAELCGLTVRDADLANHRVVVMGKGRKERHIPVSSRTEQAIWRYKAQRGELRAGDPLFLSSPGTPMDRSGLYRMVSRLGERAGVAEAYPHRFRHTFAINFLRNGGNVFALQRILGHESLEMVKRYLSLAQMDLDKAHQDASPVANWLL